MLQKLTIQKHGNWAKLVGYPNKMFADLLRQSVKQNYRKYDTDDHTWMIHWSCLRSVSQLAQNIYPQVDWSQLPENWQLYLAGAEISLDEDKEIKPSVYYDLLFVTQDAPNEVIKAAYHALSIKYHPDHGGTDIQMTQLNTAYKFIKDLRQF